MAAKQQEQSTFPEIRLRIDNGRLEFGQIIIIVVCMLLNMSDGFDVVAMSVAITPLSEDWGIPRPELGVILSAALFGMCFGAMFLAPLSDVIGRRKIVIISMCLITASMFATAYASSVTQLVIIRTLAGLGIGAILAAATSIATEFSPERLRNFAVSIIVCGYPIGMTIVGPVSGYILDHYSWETIFLVCGWTNLALLILSILFIPESMEFLASRKNNPEQRLEKINHLLTRIKREPLDTLPETKSNTDKQQVTIFEAIKSLLVPKYASTTIRLWTIFFCGFLALYFCVSWIPKLFVESGYTLAQGITALTWFNLGGVIGIIGMSLATTRYLLKSAIVPMFATSAVVMLIFALFKPSDLTQLNGLIFFIGITLQGAFTCMYAVAARSYPTEIRTTGVGWSIGLGRFGAVLGPILVGFLLLDMYALFILFSIPMILAAILVRKFKV